MKPAIRIGVLTAAITVTLWGAGLAGFVQDIPAPPDVAAAESDYDGIVVLTGDFGRIESGLRALTAAQDSDGGGGKRLLISGVNAELESNIILNAIGIPSHLSSCCIDLGRAALDTRGNAVEAALWAKQHHFRSLLIITSDYHMPRTLVEFERAFPDVDLVPMPVATDPGIITISLEYSKYLISLARFEPAGP